MTGDIETVQVRIKGRVQGVGYRMWTQRTALDAGLAGWVRNRRDGSVEALFQGPASAVRAMLACCERGPAGAAVTAVEVINTDLLAEGVVGFEVRETV